MIVREAVRADDAALLRIESASSQGDKLGLAEDRFSFFHRADRFERSIVLVGENERTGALLGVMAASIVRVRIRGEYRTAAYMFDLRNNPDASGGLSKALFVIWKHLERRLKDEGVELLFGYVKKDNSRSLSIVQRMGATSGGMVSHFTIPVLPPRAVRGTTNVARRIAAADYRSYLAQRLDDHDLWPHIDDSDLLQSVYDRSVRALITCGSSSALVIDPTCEVRRRVTRMPALYHVAGPLARSLSRFLPIPYVPMVGHEMRIWHLMDIIAGSTPAELATVLAEANNMARRDGVHYLAAAACPGSPEARALARRAVARLDYHVMAVSWADVPTLSKAIYVDPRTL